MAISEAFWDLLGSWTGVEEQSASRWGPGAQARAAHTFKLDLGGAAVVQDYRQVRDDGGEFLAHGVFLADESRPEAVLWWLFDSAAHTPEPAPGGWADGILALTRSSPRAVATHRFRLGPDWLAYDIDVAVDGEQAAPFLRGQYHRISGH